MYYVVLDVETTGFSHAKGDRLLEAAAWKFDENGMPVGERFDMLVDPHRMIPVVVLSLTHITPEMVAGKENEDQAAAALRDFMGDAMPVGHSGDFDLGFLAAIDCRYIGLPLVDTYKIAKVLFPSEKHGLGDLVRAHETHQPDADPRSDPPWHVEPHRAYSDAYATGKLLFFFRDYCEKMPATELAVLRSKYPTASDGLGFFFNSIVRGYGVDRVGQPAAFAPVVTRTLKLRVLVSHIIDHAPQSMARSPFHL